MEEKIKRLEICIYIILALLAINTIALFASLQDPKEEKADAETTENTEYDVSMFDTITADEFVSAYNGNDVQVVYFGRSSCGYCVQFLPTLRQAQTTYGYKTLYVDIANIDEAGAGKITGLNDFLNETYGQTPLVAIVKNGEIVDYQLGYTDYSSFASLLEKNGFTK